MQVVHLHERNSGGTVHPAHDRGVVARWKACDDRRFARVRWSVAAVLNILDLVVRDDAANNRMPPVVIAANHSSVSVVQFQRRISEEIRNIMLAQLRANSTYDHVSRLTPLNDESANHYVIASLHKATGTNIAQN